MRCGKSTAVDLDNEGFASGAEESEQMLNRPRCYDQLDIRDKEASKVAERTGKKSPLSKKGNLEDWTRTTKDHTS